MCISKLLPIILLGYGLSLAQSDTPLGNLSADKLGKYIAQSVRATAANQARQVDVLSDTQGVDLQPYIRDSVISAVRKNWYSVIPDKVRAPNLKQGNLAIRFVVEKSGKVEEMFLEESSGDAELDRAAWRSITSSSPYPPLPAEFHGDSVRLRFHFYYNPPTKEQFPDVGNTAVAAGPHSEQSSAPLTPTETSEEEPPVLPQGYSNPPVWLFESTAPLPRFRDDGSESPIVRVGGGVKAPKVKYWHDPDFCYKPNDARRRTVVLLLIVGSDGLPHNVKVARSVQPDMDQAAVETVKKWKFAPATMNGKPVAVQINIEVLFHPC